MKVYVFLLLFAGYIVYSVIVYIKGTKTDIKVSKKEEQQIAKGKSLYQQYNCTACHQLYGLGGYLGPELTTAYSDSNRGELYLKAFLKNGGPRMPKFNFTDEDISAIISFLKYVDATAITYKRPER